MSPLRPMLLVMLAAAPASAQPAPQGAGIQPTPQAASPRLAPPGAGGQSTARGAGSQTVPPGAATPAAAAQPADIPPVLPPNLAHVALVTQEAERRGIPPALGHAVATVESGWNPAAVGADGEVGLMQVLPSTAAMLGFRGTLAELADPATNVRLGVQYLGDAWFLARGDLCAALMKYRAGHGEDVMSARSVEYCARVRAYLAAVGSPLASTLPPTAIRPAQARVRQGPRGIISTDRFWASWSRKVHPGTRQANR